MSENGQKDTAGVVAPPPLIYAGPLLLDLGLQRMRPLALWPRRLARPIGWPLTVGALLGGAWAVRTMRAARTPVNPAQPVARIVTAGPFRFSRNPIYLCFTLLYVGAASLANTLWPILWLPGVLAVMGRGVIAREERYLERRFDDEYVQYRARVRRWI